MLRIDFLAFLIGLRHVEADRTFNGLYTIVNAATGRKLVADTQGFYTATTDFIPKTHLWRIIPDENATHLIQNAALEVRVYAQVGLDREKGFFVIGSDTPVYRDQRWHLQWNELGEGYSIRNLKSGRVVSDGSDGLMATLEVQLGSFWWLISQERDEIGLELAKQHTQCLGQDASQDLVTSENAEEVFARSTRWRVEVWELVLSIAVTSSLCSLALCCRPAKAKSEFKYQIYKTQGIGSIDQVIRVECPGVRHEDIEVKLIPNGCDVILHRRPLPGLQEVWWKHRFHLSLSEGFFEFVEEHMQLEHGFLILVLRKVQQERTIRFAQPQHFQHFCMDAFDDELNWDYPACMDAGAGTEQETGCAMTSVQKMHKPDSLETLSCGSNQSTSLS